MTSSIKAYFGCVHGALFCSEGVKKLKLEVRL